MLKNYFCAVVVENSTQLLSIKTPSAHYLKKFAYGNTKFKT